jgi:5-formyltetrahydrofolate cyclo-ligase
MSFDIRGYRLGYGKGYYDRFLSGYNGTKVGLCYSNCVKWKLPNGKYDETVDILVTERYFRKIKNPIK